MEKKKAFAYLGTHEIGKTTIAVEVINRGLSNVVESVCDCGKPHHERDLEHGMCHQCWEPTKEAN